MHRFIHQKWADERSFSPMQDNFTVIKALEEMWQCMQRDIGTVKLFKVSILLHDLFESQEVTLDLFEMAQEGNSAKNEGLSQAMDALNKRYGINTINIGSCPKTSAGYVGTKIAFTRVPEQAEFLE